MPMNVQNTGFGNPFPYKKPSKWLKNLHPAFQNCLFPHLREVKVQGDIAHALEMTFGTLIVANL